MLLGNASISQSILNNVPVEISSPAFFNGKIGDVRIYGKALSAAEVQSLYEYGCADPGGTEGELMYNGDNNVMQYCNGTDWVRIGTDPCNRPGVTPGAVCGDGTVYAGLSGVSTPMYVTRCDVGQTWNGSSCTGSRLSPCWNNCNGTGYVDTSLSNSGSGYSDGQAYTAILVTEDSDSATGGTQPHLAAQYCADLSLHGYNDWYLPARDELMNTIYTNNAAIGNFDTSGAYYWSSSESSSFNARVKRFSNGSYETTAGKQSNTFAVRCARR